MLQYIISAFCRAMGQCEPGVQECAFFDIWSRHSCSLCTTEWQRFSGVGMFAGAVCTFCTCRLVISFAGALLAQAASTQLTAADAAPQQIGMPAASDAASSDQPDDASETGTASDSKPAAAAPSAAAAAAPQSSRALHTEAASKAGEGALQGDAYAAESESEATGVRRQLAARCILLELFTALLVMAMRSHVRATLVCQKRF